MTASEQLRDMVNGFRISQALHVAAVLGVSDLLADGPLDLESLARAADADPESLRRLLRALAAVGVFVETDEGGYANSELSEALRTGAPGSVKGWATLIGEPYFWGAWGNLFSGTRSGANPFTTLYGIDVWAYRAGDVTRTAVFDAAMTELASQDGGRGRRRLRLPRARPARRYRWRARSPSRGGVGRHTRRCPGWCSTFRTSLPERPRCWRIRLRGNGFAWSPATCSSQSPPVATSTC